MKRAKSQSVIARKTIILEQIKEVKNNHPFWGYCKVWSYLKYHNGLPVNTKRIQRLMKERDLLVGPDVRNKTKRRPIRHKPHTEVPQPLLGY
jgi:putative transposase